MPSMKRFALLALFVFAACSDPPADGTPRYDTTASADDVVNGTGDVAVQMDGLDTITPDDTGESIDVESPVDVEPADTTPMDGIDPDTGETSTVPEGCCDANNPCTSGELCLDSKPGPGICQASPKPGWCWEDAQCPGGQVCHGAEICPCGATCKTHHPGVCVPTSGCAPIEVSWVEETCNAANVVVFNGTECVETCFGCCGCGPFCDKTFSSIEECEGSCVPKDCPTFITALADCPHHVSPTETCPKVSCKEASCGSDSDCPAPDVTFGANWCVLGNCSDCWQDGQCPGGQMCRAGRCVNPADACPKTGACSDPGCALVTLSESPCPTCVCGTPFNKPCTADLACQSISSFQYSYCVFGRCTECRADNDCTDGTCAAPGVCLANAPSAAPLYGNWVIGWPGGLDHFSYLRFEPDGTLRRGVYEQGGTFFDDFPSFPCFVEDAFPVTQPLMGTWQVVNDETGLLMVDMSIAIACDPGPGWTARYAIAVSDDGQSINLTDQGDNNLNVIGWPAPPAACSDDMSLCETPSFDF
ncbi:MAG: hypothetical protein ACI9OJ_005629 [Myxococcota bacterium]|jgi:hypothetical protein